MYLSVPVHTYMIVNLEYDCNTYGRFADPVDSSRHLGAEHVHRRAQLQQGGKSTGVMSLPLLYIFIYTQYV